MYLHMCIHLYKCMCICISAYECECGCASSCTYVCACVYSSELAEDIMHKSTTRRIC